VIDGTENFRVKNKQSNDLEEWSLLIAGDISPTDNIQNIMKQDYIGNIFGNLLPEIQSADLSIFNLETAF